MLVDAIDLAEEKRTIDLVRPLVLLWLAGVSLRVTILALPPVLHAVQSDFHLRGSDIGVLTALPPLFFSLAAVPGAAFISRFGAVRILVAGLLINALGAAARGLTGDVVGLEAATSVMCFGVAVMQPAMPTLVRTWTPTRIGLATATYTCGLLCGEVLPVLWSFAPRLSLFGGGWRATLFQWSLPVLATAFLTMGLKLRVRPEHKTRVLRTWPNWRETSIWRVGLLLGAVNASYFGLNGFVPGWLAQAGGPEMIRPALLTLNLAQIPASLLMMVFLERLVFRSAGYVIAGSLALAGSVGLATAPPAFAIVFAAMAGFALAWLLTLALALPPFIVPEEEVPGFSAAVFTFSYAVAVLTAILTGALENSGLSRSTTILPIAAAALAIVAVGATIRRLPREQTSHGRK